MLRLSKCKSVIIVQRNFRRRYGIDAPTAQSAWQARIQNYILRGREGLNDTFYNGKMCLKKKNFYANNNIS